MKLPAVLSLVSLAATVSDRRRSGSAFTAFAPTAAECRALFEITTDAVARRGFFKNSGNQSRVGGVLMAQATALTPPDRIEPFRQTTAFGP